MRSHIQQIVLFLFIYGAVSMPCLVLAADATASESHSSAPVALTQEKVTQAVQNNADTPSSALGNQTAAQTQPKIRLCNNPKDTLGVWRLVRVLETSEGERSKDLKVNPFQFIWMNKKTAFSEFKSKTPPKGKKNVVNQMRKQKAFGATQYVLDGKNGVLFIYKNQKFSHSYSCGIVQNKASIYKRGDMILTPTKDNKNNQFELYRRVKR
jgi:hypothetical protein